jgi:hypothetical protein
MRTKPYRNPRIISVIRDLYFLGGVGSFAGQFRDRFATYQGVDGVLIREVPVSMVALVATAVRSSCDFNVSC